MYFLYRIGIQCDGKLPACVSTSEGWDEGAKREGREGRKGRRRRRRERADLFFGFTSFLSRSFVLVYTGIVLEG